MVERSLQEGQPRSEAQPFQKRSPYRLRTPFIAAHAILHAAAYDQHSENGVPPEWARANRLRSATGSSTLYPPARRIARIVSHRGPIQLAHVAPAAIACATAACCIDSYRG